MKITQAYKLMLCEYPDVLNSKQVAELLGGVSIKKPFINYCGMVRLNIL